MVIAGSTNFCWYFFVIDRDSSLHQIILLPNVQPCVLYIEYSQSLDEKKDSFYWVDGCMKHYENDDDHLGVDPSSHSLIQRQNWLVQQNQLLPTTKCTYPIFYAVWIYRQKVTGAKTRTEITKIGHTKKN